MTSERPRFPIGLTFAAVVVVAICTALGVWQLGRAQWKAEELKRIDALKTAPPQPMVPVLARAATGHDETFTRVSADCAAGSAPAGFLLTTDNGDWIARAQATCRLTGAAFDGILVDRGFLTASRGTTNTPSATLPAPSHVSGVLYRTSTGRSVLIVGLERAAPYVLVAEHEDPAPPGVTPAPYPDAASNLEYVGTYAPTWFGLAVVALCFYAAMLWRRYHPKR